ncbi:MAG: hypothetical protein C0611_07380, partial [Desulfobacteraceae bacterium]
ASCAPECRDFAKLNLLLNVICIFEMACNRITLYQKTYSPFKDGFAFIKNKLTGEINGTSYHPPSDRGF